MKVVNKRKEPFTIYVGRGSIFGNPFIIDRDGTRDEVIEKYEAYARATPYLLKAIKSLPEDAILGCYCSPNKCHGDVIIKLWSEEHEK